MSNFYYDNPAISYVPRCTTNRFLDWLDRFRTTRRDEALVMANGSTVYYFSTTGNDSNDGLTTGTPKKTIGAALAILEAWSNSAAGLVLKFKCGDIWQPDTVGEGKLETSGAKSNYCITYYGDLTLGLPFFNRWKTPFIISSAETSVTRGDAFTNTYSLVKPGAESWYTIRPYGRYDVHYRHVSSIAEVDANPGTCWVDHAGAGRIYFSRFTTSTQLLEYYECLTPDPTMTVGMIGNNNTTGVIGTGKIAVIGVEISGVCIGTFGAESTAGNAIHMRCYGDATLYVLDSRITYSSRHHIVIASGTGGQPSFAGGIMFIDNCSIGWQSASGGATLTVANSLNGESEQFISNCTILGGNILRPTVTSGGTAFYAHSNQPSILNIAYKCRATATPGQVTSLGGWDNTSTAATIDDCRHFFVDCHIPHRNKYMNEGLHDGLNRWSANNIGTAQVVINSSVGISMLGSATATGNTVESGALTGIYVNCTFSVDCGIDNSRPVSDVCSFHSSAANATHANFNCAFVTSNVQAGRFVWIGNQWSSGTLPASQYPTRHCVFVNRSSQVRKVVPKHNAVHYGFRTSQCGYSGISLYYDNTLVTNANYTTQDPLYVAVPEMGYAGGVPDELAISGNSYVTFAGVDYELEYDASGLPRLGRNAIGPRRLDVSESAVNVGSSNVIRQDSMETVMPGESVILPLGQGNTGLPIYGVLYNSAGEVWDGDSFETYGTSARNTGAADLGLASEIGVTGTYKLTIPAEVTEYGSYWVHWFRRLGGVGVYAITDTEYGMTYFRVGDTLLDLDAAFFRIRNAGSGGAVEYENADGSVRFTATPAAANGAFAGVTRP